jgi:hypothetical protein
MPKPYPAVFTPTTRRSSPPGHSSMQIELLNRKRKEDVDSEMVRLGLAKNKRGASSGGSFRFEQCVESK